MYITLQILLINGQLRGCLDGSVKIPLLDGTTPTIKELYNKYKNNPKNNGKDTIDYLYSYDFNTNKFTVGELVRVFFTGIKDVYELTLDTGKKIVCTADHPFLDKNKHWRTLRNGLKVGDSLMSFRRENNDGYEIIVFQENGKIDKQYTHRMVIEYKDGILQTDKKYEGHHKDGNPFNNKPSNLCGITKTQHKRYHTRLNWKNNDYFKECARRSLQSLNHKIVAIKHLGKRPTYDLTVRGHHNFALDCGLVSKNSTGTGKSTVATYSLCYELYKLMCLKDPNRFYLGANETIWFLFFNLNLKLAEKTMWGKFQKALQKSPWFMERGTVTGRTNLIYQPNKDIKLDIGSTEEHALSVAVMFCLDGDTKILTEDGYKTLRDLENKKIKVYTTDEMGCTNLSDDVIIKQTMITNELYEIELENGFIFRCTGNHRMKLQNGDYKMAKDLTLDDELAEVDTNVGIYRLYNTLNGKSYVGQSTQLKMRKWRHYNNPKQIILDDLAGEDFSKNIKFEVLEYCPENLLDIRERYYIDKYNSIYPNGYNRQSCGKSGFGVDKKLKTIFSEQNMQPDKHQKIVENWHNNVLGRIWVNDGKNNEYIKKDELNLYLDAGYKKGRLLSNSNKKNTVFIYKLNNWSIKQINESDIDNYIKLGYKEGLLRKNGYIWFYEDTDFKSAERMANYLKLHNYPNITRSAIENIIKGTYKGEYQDLCEKIYRVKALDLYKEVSKYEN